MLIVVEAVAVGDLAFDATNGQVHPGETPSGVVRLLSQDGDVSSLTTQRRTAVYLAGIATAVRPRGSEVFYQRSG